MDKTITITDANIHQSAPEQAIIRLEDIFKVYGMGGNRS